MLTLNIPQKPQPLASRGGLILHSTGDMSQSCSCIFFLIEFPFYSFCFVFCYGGLEHNLIPFRTYPLPLLLTLCPPRGPFNPLPTALIPHDLPHSPLCPAPCTSPPSGALPGTFAPRPGLIHLATPLRPGELKALFVCTPWEILTPRLHAPTKQRKHLLTAKALTNSAFQMNPAPCGAGGRGAPRTEKPKTLACFCRLQKTWWCCTRIMSS